MKTHIVFLFLICTFISGCSLAFDRTTQEIYVTTSNATDAYCVLETKKHRYQLFTPSKLRIERSAYDIIVTCDKKGYKTAYKTIKSKAIVKTAWSGLNRYTPGLGADTLTRTVYSYPTSISIPLSHEN